MLSGSARWRARGRHSMPGLGRPATRCNPQLEDGPPGHGAAPEPRVLQQGVPAGQARPGGPRFAAAVQHGRWGQRRDAADEEQLQGGRQGRHDGGEGHGGGQAAPGVDPAKDDSADQLAQQVGAAQVGVGTGQSDDVLLACGGKWEGRVARPASDGNMHPGTTGRRRRVPGCSLPAAPSA